MITQKELQQLFQYRDGNLYWNVARQKTAVGRKAGSVNTATGYEVIVINGNKYKTHRLVFLMLNGYLPKEIDHINRVKTDNRIENLREIMHSQNCSNVGIKKSNTSGFPNVSWNIAKKKWNVRIRANGKQNNLGYFNDLELAGLVAMEAKNKFHNQSIKINGAK